jgi:hypothetical protein
MNPADDIPQSERRRIMGEERRGRTYQGHAIASADEDRGGRFAFSGNSTSVTGANPGSVYPKMPAGNPWANNPYPPEPLIDGTGEGSQLGYAIDGPGDAANTDLGRVATDARATGIKLRRRI